MTIVDDFLNLYFRFAVGQRAFEDVCRQMAECTGDINERQQLVDESCRLAIYVSDTSEELESLSMELINELQDEEDRDDDFLNDVALCVNQVIEDRARANSYTNQVTYLRIGGTPRKPRMPRVANPFVPLVQEQADPSEIEDGTDDDIISGEEEQIVIDNQEEPVVAQEQSGRKWPRVSFRWISEKVRQKRDDDIVFVTEPMDDVPEEESEREAVTEDDESKEEVVSDTVEGESDEEQSNVQDETKVVSEEETDDDSEGEANTDSEVEGEANTDSEVEGEANTDSEEEDDTEDDSDEDVDDSMIEVPIKNNPLAEESKRILSDKEDEPEDGAKS